MKRFSTLLVLCLFCYVQMAAQTFELFPSNQNIPYLNAVELGSIASADVDGDGDQDVIYAGADAEYETATTYYYINNGDDTFTEVEDHPFPGVAAAWIGFADVDGDGDQDALIHGSTDVSCENAAGLFLNDGDGNFTASASVFEALATGRAPYFSRFVDLDNDGDQDFVQVGLECAFGGETEIHTYLNDGSGNFTGTDIAPFTGFDNTSVFFDMGDVDGDGDMDVVINAPFPNSSMVKLYLNNSGTFIEGSLSFDYFAVGGMKLFDYDVDGDLDLFVMATTETNDMNETVLVSSRQFFGFGNGNFDEINSIPTGLRDVPVERSLIDFRDMDGDGIQDYIFSYTGIEFDQSTGEFGETFDSQFRVYKGTGSGFYQQITEDLGSENFTAGYFMTDFIFADLVGDDALDFWSVSKPYGSQIFEQGESFEFSTATPTPFLGTQYGITPSADLNGDDLPEVYFTGFDNAEDIRSGVFFNLDDGNFETRENTNLPEVGPLSTVVFADVDGDGDQDVLTAAVVFQGDTIARSTDLHLNDGTGIFTKVEMDPFADVIRGVAAFADVDGDGDQDVLITGVDSDDDDDIAPQFMSNRFYLNDGNGNYTISGSVPSNFVTTLSFIDADNDGDQDLMLQEFILSGDFGAQTTFYQNNGTGLFSLVNTPFANIASGNIAWADVDGDGDQDVLITGMTTIQEEGEQTTKLYLNQGNLTFVEDTENEFAGVAFGSAEFADADKDGDLDLLITNALPIDFDGVEIDEIVNELYLNDGSGVFTEMEDYPFEEVFGTAHFDDYDNDGDADVIINGLSGETGQLIALIYENTTLVSTNEQNILSFRPVYPNPSMEGIINVNYPSLMSGKVNVAVHDSNGQQVAAFRKDVAVGDNPLTFDCSSLPSGMYNLSIRQGEQQFAQKFAIIK